MTASASTRAGRFRCRPRQARPSAHRASAGRGTRASAGRQCTTSSGGTRRRVRLQARSQGDKETKPTPNLGVVIGIGNRPFRAPSETTFTHGTTRGVGGKRGGKLANGPAYFLTVDFFRG